eukprot:2375555-Rhodomonas_salina.1
MYVRRHRKGPVREQLVQVSAKTTSVSCGIANAGPGWTEMAAMTGYVCSRGARDSGKQCSKTLVRGNGESRAEPQQSPIDFQCPIHSPGPRSRKLDPLSLSLSPWALPWVPRARVLRTSSRCRTP